MILLFENIIRGGVPSVTGSRYVKSYEKNVVPFDDNNLSGWAMIQSLLFDQIKFDKNCELQDILKTWWFW